MAFVAGQTAVIAGDAGINFGAAGREHMPATNQHSRHSSGPTDTIPPIRSIAKNRFGSGIEIRSFDHSPLELAGSFEPFESSIDLALPRTRRTLRGFSGLGFSLILAPNSHM